MKLKVVVLSFILFAFILTGCGKNNNQAGTPTTQPTNSAPAPTTTNGNTPTTAAESPDAVTSASIVDTEEAFLKAIGSTGTWIIAITGDLTVDKDLVMEGEFKNGKKDEAGQDIIQRKLALYSQDANRVVTARYTLTAPKLTVRSPKASIQHGTFKGDLYVDVKEFQLIDTTVDGNVYFMKQEYMDSFVMDETSKITGSKSLVK